jgi:hypothetical protein
VIGTDLRRDRGQRRDDTVRIGLIRSFANDDETGARLPQSGLNHGQRTRNRRLNRHGRPRVRAQSLLGHQLKAIESGHTAIGTKQCNGRVVIVLNAQNLTSDGGARVLNGQDQGTGRQAFGDKVPTGFAVVAADRQQLEGRQFRVFVVFRLATFGQVTGVMMGHTHHARTHQTSVNSSTGVNVAEGNVRTS